MTTEIQYGALVMVITGLIEVYKSLGLPSKYLKLAGLISGIAINGLVTKFQPDLGLTIFWGIVIGLASVGLYLAAEKPISMTGDYLSAKLGVTRCKTYLAAKFKK